mgnify:CR=1 FL=1|tara:strand:+ start:2943 stop:4610 length:1668 start_codon:yes stop_codon:yes gene_type:complete
MFAPWIHNLALAALALLLSVGAEAQTGEKTVVPVGSPAFYEADVLPGQTSVEIAVPVSEATRLQLQVLAPVPSPQFTLLNPAGAPVALNQATLLSGSAQQPALPGAALYTPWLDLPSNGIWRLRVNFAPATQRTVVGVTAFLDSPIRAAVLLGGTQFRQGDAIAASLFLLNGDNPVTGAAVSLTARSPSGQTIDLAANDAARSGSGDARANDGLYTGALVFEEVGTYLFQGRAQFNAPNGSPVLRETRAVALVSPPKLSLTGIGAGVRTGPRNCVAAHTVSLSTALLTAGQVVAKATLRAANGRRITRTQSLSATPGTLPLTLDFPANDIRNELAADGPYTVELVQIVVNSADGTTLEASASDAAVTAAVTLSALCQEAVRIGSDATVTPVVTNGYISALNISFPVGVTVAGNYRVSFRVTGGERQQVAAFSLAPNLTVGTTPISVNVPATSLQAADGPFQVESVLVLGPAGSASVSVIDGSGPLLRWQFTPTIRGDLNGDGSVDAADRDLLASFRNVRSISPGDRRDLDRNGLIDLRDVQLLQRLYCAAGSCPR